jgi:hypothetical protein
LPIAGTAAASFRRKWEQALLGIVEPAPEAAAKVVPMRRGKRR